jgi:hypothetical protein
MQARFVSLRVTETWQMVQSRDATSATTFATSPHEIDPRAAESHPRKLEATPAREPLPVD